MEGGIPPGKCFVTYSSRKVLLEDSLREGRAWLVAEAALFPGISTRGERLNHLEPEL